MKPNEFAEAAALLRQASEQFERLNLDSSPDRTSWIAITRFYVRIAMESLEWATR